MSNSYNIDQKNLTIDSIFDALLLILEKKDFNKISVSEVTRKAGVSRMAFYRNFMVLEDVLTCRLKAINQEYNELISGKTINNYELIKVYFQHIRKQKEFITILLNSGLSHLLLAELIEYIEKLSELLVCDIECETSYREYNTKFIAGGFFNVINFWCSGEMRESDEQMAELIYNRVSNHIIAVNPA